MKGLAFAFVFAALAPLRAAAASTVVVLVRHAEKGTDDPINPSLSPAGKERAQALAEALKDAGVTAIVTSGFKRAKETAEPLAQALGLTPVVVAVQGSADAHAKKVVSEIGRHGGEVVLVVGHANTVPAIVAALGAPRPADFEENEYSDLLIVVVNGKRSKLIRSHYGPPDPATEAGPARPMGVELKK